MRRMQRLAPSLALALGGCGVAVQQAATPRAITTDSLRTEVIADGVRHLHAWHAHGPWAVHRIEIDLGACGIELRTIKAGGQVVGRETTSAMAQRAATELGRDVLVAINADFFSFDPPGRPEGPQVAASRIVKSEGTHREALEDRRVVSQPVFALARGERPWIGSATFSGSVRIGDLTLPLDGINVTPSADGAVLYDRWIGAATPADSAAFEIVMRPLGTREDTVTAEVVSVDTSAAGVPLEGNAVALAARGRAAQRARTLAAGDTVRWVAEFPAIGAPVEEMVGGFPLLLSGGRAVHAAETGLRAAFANNRHPRSAIGLRPDGRLVLLTVDGRQPGYSEGMSLDELAWYLRATGITEALNFDGGGSTTLVIDGRIVNRPSDAAGERAVANALLVLGPPPGSCTAPDAPSRTLRGDSR
jgi:hypothetical protein